VSFRPWSLQESPWLNADNLRASNTSQPAWIRRPSGRQYCLDILSKSDLNALIVKRLEQHSNWYTTFWAEI
jgi:hypothetical protein